MTQLRREIRVPVYWLLVGLAMLVVSPMLSIIVSVKINQRTIEQNEAAKQDAAQRVETAKREATAEALVRYCRLIGSQIDVYAEATTPVGKEAHRTWLIEYQTAGCVPPRR